MPNETIPSRPPTLRWHGGVDGYLEILDQRALPGKVVTLRLDTSEDAWHAIRNLAVRGAPAIGLTGAYAMVLAARTISPSSQSAMLIEHLRMQGDYLKTARPTAVNLEWAIDQMIRTAVTERAIGVRQLQQRMLREAHDLLERDCDICLAIGRNGMAFMKPGIGVLTHCNAGALATSDHGTALAILYEARRQNISFKVFADETRPLLQGARLTTFELSAAGIPVTLLCDSMAGLVMREKKVQLVLVGADRIAANGDTANKIGTYSVAVLAKAHGIPMVVAAPMSTFDLSLRSGNDIPIEQRDPAEVTEPFGTRIAPPGVAAYNPAFDVTPAELISAIVTERGVISPVNESTVRAMIDR